MRSFSKLLLVFGATALSSPTSAQDLRGTATAGDGDTFTLGTTVIRLYGIDAPESDQTCQRGGQVWACGMSSKHQLAALLASGEVRCSSYGIDVHGRTLAVCGVNGLDINRTMVAQGWAIAFRSYSAAYIPDETRAKAARLGLWNSTFELPEDFRAARAARSEATRTTRALSTASDRAASLSEPFGNGRCAIKGNRNRRGQWIYHVPGMPYYEATRAEEIFCSEAAAQAAGYRRALVR